MHRTVNYVQSQERGKGPFPSLTFHKTPYSVEKGILSFAAVVV